MRNTTAATSRTRRSITTPATWPCCAPASKARRWCWRPPRRRSKAGSTRARASIAGSTCGPAMARRSCPRWPRSTCGPRRWPPRAGFPPRWRGRWTSGWRGGNSRCCSSTAAAMRRSRPAAPAGNRSAATTATRGWWNTASRSASSATSAGRRSRSRWPVRPAGPKGRWPRSDPAWSGSPRRWRSGSRKRARRCCPRTCSSRPAR